MRHGTTVSGTRAVLSRRAIALAAAVATMFCATMAALPQPAAASLAVWSNVATPSPGTGNVRLLGISCVSTTRCVAVGYHSPGYLPNQTLAETWNGTAWSIAATPTISIHETELTGVSCTSASWCVAVGYADSNGLGLLHTLAEVWNGSTWSVVTTPSAGSAGAQFDAVSCRTATMCFAVGVSATTTSGQTLVERWNGANWSVVPSPNHGGSQINNRLWGVACTSSTNCFAVGAYSVQPQVNITQPFVERWNGSKWSIIASPTKGSYGELLGLSCSSASACTAVGDYAGASGVDDTLVERWNGVAWTITAAPNVGTVSNLLFAVSCTAATSCVAVGGKYSTTFTEMIETWNGTRWTVAHATPPGNQSGLEGVTCVTATRCYAVGWANNVGDAFESAMVQSS